MILATILVIVPYLIGVISLLYERPQKYFDPHETLSYPFIISAMYSLGLSQLVFAFLGGNAIACERPDRSAEFLAYLPISRGKILTSKLLLAFLTAAFIWVVNLSILGICWLSLRHYLLTQFNVPFDRNMEEIIFIGRSMVGLLITGSTFFCVGWFFSSFLESPTFSICIGLVTPLLVAIPIIYIVNHLGLQEIMILYLYCGVCLLLALASFAGGTWYYLWRVEP
jgi:ABC-type transport system involved in multi-copper enzyme maturation permease subunit